MPDRLSKIGLVGPRPMRGNNDEFAKGGKVVSITSAGVLSAPVNIAFSTVTDALNFVLGSWCITVPIYRPRYAVD
jgi:hypothetical protein